MITRSDEVNLPNFATADDAFRYLDETFGNLTYESRDIINGKGISFYDHHGQSVQIWDDGKLHICY